MRFFIVFIAFVWVFVFLNGCGNAKRQMGGKSDRVKTIVIPTVVDAKSIDIIRDLDYLILEAKENSYFGYVSKMRVYKDRIYILDGRYAKSLLIYTKEGQHIATLGDKRGRGPLEFIDLLNFEIDYVNDQILTLDDFGRKFMIYDLDGNFVKRVDSNISLLNAVLLPNGCILHAQATWHKTSVKNWQIIITDDSKQIIEKRFEYDDNENLNVHVSDIITAQMDGGFNFAPKFRDTIYSVSFESITPKYAIDYGNNRKIPKTVIDGLGSIPEFEELINAWNTCFMGYHVESKDVLHLSLGYRNLIYVFYNKQTNNTVAISSQAKLSECEYDLCKIRCSDSDGYFYGAFNFAHMDELIKLFPELQKIDDAEDMNPIIFRYKVKI